MYQKALIIAPGAGDPKSEAYGDVYALLNELAALSGEYSKSTILGWPGHHSHGQMGSLSLESATAILVRELESRDRRGLQFDILARSFGCWVALNALLTLRVKNLQRVLLWGPCSYVQVWETLVLNFNETVRKGSEKGCQIDGRLFLSMKPFEHLLENVLLASPSVHVRVCTGKLDPVVTESFLGWLDSMKARFEHFSAPAPIPGAEHEVTHANANDETVRLYARTLFEPLATP